MGGGGHGQQSRRDQIGAGQAEHSAHGDGRGRRQGLLSSHTHLRASSTAGLPKRSGRSIQLISNKKKRNSEGTGEVGAHSQLKGLDVAHVVRINTEA